MLHFCGSKFLVRYSKFPFRLRSGPFEGLATIKPPFRPYPLSVCGIDEWPAGLFRAPRPHVLCAARGFAPESRNRKDHLQTKEKMFCILSRAFLPKRSPILMPAQQSCRPGDGLPERAFLRHKIVGQFRCIQVSLFCRFQHALRLEPHAFRTFWTINVQCSTVRTESKRASLSSCRSLL